MQASDVGLEKSRDIVRSDHEAVERVAGSLDEVVMLVKAVRNCLLLCSVYI